MYTADFLQKNNNLWIKFKSVTMEKIDMETIQIFKNPSACCKKVSQLLDFDGFGTVSNAKHPWLGYTQSWIQQKQRWSVMELVTHGYMLYSLGYTVEYWIHQNLAKAREGFWSLGQLGLTSRSCNTKVGRCTE